MEKRIYKNIFEVMGYEMKSRGKRFPAPALVMIEIKY
jgi:hypothetical protein